MQRTLTRDSPSPFRIGHHVYVHGAHRLGPAGSWPSSSSATILSLNNQVSYSSSSCSSVSTRPVEIPAIMYPATVGPFAISWPTLACGERRPTIYSKSCSTCFYQMAEKRRANCWTTHRPLLPVSTFPSYSLSLQSVI